MEGLTTLEKHRYATVTKFLNTQALSGISYETKIPKEVLVFATATLVSQYCKRSADQAHGPTHGCGYHEVLPDYSYSGDCSNVELLQTLKGFSKQRLVLILDWIVYYNSPTGRNFVRERYLEMLKTYEEL